MGSNNGNKTENVKSERSQHSPLCSEGWWLSVALSKQKFLSQSLWNYFINVSQNTGFDRHLTFLNPGKTLKINLWPFIGCVVSGRLSAWIFCILHVSVGMMPVIPFVWKTDGPHVETTWSWFTQWWSFKSCQESMSVSYFSKILWPHFNIGDIHRLVSHLRFIETLLRYHVSIVSAVKFFKPTAEVQ